MAPLPKSAVLLMDLQRDFLTADGARMPVGADGAETVLQMANAILSKKLVPEALPILIVNQFPASARIANFFRKSAAIAGSSGAELDARLDNTGSVKVIAKAKPSAFSNPELDRYLRANGVQQLYVLGVFAEGCVRSTVIEAIKRDYTVYVISNAIASKSAWNKRFALWSMKCAGAIILSDLAAQ